MRRLIRLSWAVLISLNILAGTLNADEEATISGEGFESIPVSNELLGRAIGDKPLLAPGFSFHRAADFEGGLPIPGTNAIFDIGGYVKADFIHDFDPIASTDSFDTTTIEVGAPDRTNFRFHARQTRLNLDVRWPTRFGRAKLFIETDFFGGPDVVSNEVVAEPRLRHAYGQIGPVTVGQTWTTFQDVDALPSTLDLEGSASVISRRQALVRWTQPIYEERVLFALALENPRVILDPAPLLPGEARTPTPDLIGQLRYDGEFIHVQGAYLVRELGFQPPGGEVFTAMASGFNFTGALKPTRKDKVVFEVLFGEGIGSYRGLPDIAPTAADQLDLLPIFGWMIGYTREISSMVTANFTYGEGRIDNLAFQEADDLKVNAYLAVNMIWNPVDRVFVGIEYLYGERENFGGASASANRVQVSFIYDLP